MGCTIWRGSAPFSSSATITYRSSRARSTANPIFLLLAVWVAVDIVRRRIRPAQVAALVALAAQLFLLMLHKSFGGFQFGLRYTADLIPCALTYFVLSGRHRRVRWGEAALMAAALVFFVIGALSVHI